MHALRIALSTVTKWVVVTMLLVMIAVLFAQIVCRYFFEAPLVWSEELAMILMLWVTYLGAALLLESREHISIDYLVELMPIGLQHIVGILAAMLMLIFNLALTYGAYLVVQATSASILPGLKISGAWHYGGTLVGGTLLILVSLDQLFLSFARLAQGRD